MEQNELLLLKGLPISLPFGNIFSPTLNEIIELNVDIYHQYLFILFNFKKKILNEEELEGLSDFQASLILLDNPLFTDFFIAALSFFFKERVRFQYTGVNDGLFYLGELEEEKIIDENNFDEVMKIIKIANYLLDKEEVAENPANDKAKELLEKRKKAREKLAKAKNKDTESLNLSDLVSISISKINGVNIFNVWDLTIYQFYNQFKRLQLIDQYDVSLKVLAAGAGTKDKEFKHWMTKI